MARSIAVRVGSIPDPGGGGAVTHGSQLGATNTGPEAAGYTLTDWTGSLTFSTSGQTIEGRRFNDGIQVTASNVTFKGCEFRSSWVDGFIVRHDGTNLTLENCRWRPSSTDGAPVTRAQSYQQGIKCFNGVGLTVRRSEFWGFGNAIEFEPSTATVSNPVVVEECWMHDAADQSGDAYHHDGILSSFASAHVRVRRCKIVSGGNTNAIAFQTTSGGWSDVVIEDCDLGGFGYTVNIGDSAASSNIAFTGNRFNTSIASVWGPFKNNWASFTGTNVWSSNTWDTGGYWWPTDGKTTGGHGSDYAG